MFSEIAIILKCLCMPKPQRISQIVPQVSVPDWSLLLLSNGNRPTGFHRTMHVNKEASCSSLQLLDNKASVPRSPGAGVCDCPGSGAPKGVDADLMGIPPRLRGGIVLAG